VLDVDVATIKTMLAHGQTMVDAYNYAKTHGYVGSFQNFLLYINPKIAGGKK